MTSSSRMPILIIRVVIAAGISAVTLLCAAWFLMPIVLERFSEKSAVRQAVDEVDLPRMEQYLRHPDPAIRGLLVAELDRLDRSTARGLLTLAMKDADAFVRTKAAYQLVDMGNLDEQKQAIAVLVVGLADSKPTVRRLAVVGLGEANSALLVDSTLDSVRRLASSDPDSMVRAHAVSVLPKLLGQDETASAMLAAMQDDEPQVRRAAVMAIVQFSVDGEDVMDTVRELTMDDDERVRAAAKMALDMP